MGTTEKSRKVNMRVSNASESLPDNARKSHEKKRKSTDMLGSRWNKRELQRFYEAFRQYGKDWKKVAAAVHNRSVEMVQAVYNMNRAYLSLPEGTATVVGLISMMTDHYNVMEPSYHEREINEVFGMPSQSHHTHKKAKFQQSRLKEDTSLHPKASNDGCVSSLKKVNFNGGYPRIVKKRTPRTPVQYKKAENHVSPERKCQKTDIYTNENGNFCTTASNAKDNQTPAQGPRNRSKKLLSDERTAVDALLMFADVFLRELELSAQLKDEKTMLNEGDKPNVPESISLTLQKGNTKDLGFREKDAHMVNSHEASTIDTKYKLIKYTTTDSESYSGIKEPHQGVNNKLKGRHNFLTTKVSNAEADVDSHMRKPIQTEAEEENRILMNDRQDEQVSSSSSSKQRKSIEAYAGSSSDSDRTISLDELLVSTEQVSTASQFNFRPGRKTKNKMDGKRAFPSKKTKTLENMSSFEDNKYYHNGEAFHLKKKLSSCLSSALVQKWCIFEWFYSSIDCPWFARREFMEYLYHVGMGHVPRLTRVEWSVIKNSLGKPRRFSEKFLREEREKLYQYRASVRKHYSELQCGASETLPAYLVRPLAIGQKVLVVHPQTREVYDGNVLAVDHDKCRVQFDRPEIGIGFVKDVDCMVSNPLHNMPEALALQRVMFPVPKELPVHEPTNAGGSMILSSYGLQEKTPSTIKSLIKELPTLRNLRQQQTYKMSLEPPRQKHQFVSNFSCGLSSLPEPIIYQEEYSVTEIVKGSRSKAHTMVDVAIQAMTSTKKGGDPFIRIGETLDSIDRNRPLDYSSCSVSGSMESQHDYSVSGGDTQDDTDKNEWQLPSELITSCVSSLLMIKTCTEGQYPPADVARVIDSAVTSLHPVYPQNMPNYREVQMCMGKIKTQILALIPTCK